MNARKCILLVATTTRWFGPARMPRVLARAGFDVALLTPAGSLAEHSGYVFRLGRLPVNATSMQWLQAFVRMVEASSPLQVVPCDEMAVRLLFALVLDPPPSLSAALRTSLKALITASLGDPRFYAASIDKTMLPAAAEALGVRVPRHAVVSGVDEALAHAGALGYPVFLKRRYGFAGQGAAVVATPGELVAAVPQLLRPDQLDLGDAEPPRLLVQALVRGPHHSQALVALRGVPLAGFAWERHAATSAIKGQTTVLRFVRSPETRALSETLCRGFGIGGFFNAQFIIDEQTGAAHLLEINRRIVTHTHLGERAGADLGRALHEALAGGPLVTAPDAAETGGAVVVFPREWLRDPGSRHLAELPVDVPWDEPDLLAAMLALRHEA